MTIKSLLFALILSLISFSASAEIVNINKANASALQHYLNGVGEKKAKRIVEYRKANKKFKNIDEIKEVKGIGEKLFNKIKSKLSLSKGVVSAPAKAETKTKSKKKVKTKKKKTKQKKADKEKASS